MNSNFYPSRSEDMDNECQKLLEFPRFLSSMNGIWNFLCYPKIINFLYQLIPLFFE